MPIRNTKVEYDQALIKFVQDTGVDVGTDKRRWSAEKNGDRYVFWVDGLKILKQVNDGTPETTSDINFYDATADRATITIDKNVEYLCVVYLSNIVNFRVAKVKISDMTYTDSAVVSAPNTNPLKAQLTSQGDKIVWLGDDAKFYKMDLDGGNIESVNIPIFANSGTSMSINNDGVSYIAFTNTSLQFSIIKVLPNMSTETYSSANTSLVFSPKLSFISSSNLYVVIDTSNPAYTPRLVKIPLATWDNDTTYTIVNINSIYGVENNSCVKFSLAYNGTEFYGILCENNGTDRKYMWKVDLDTLALQGLREVSKVNNSGIKTLTAQFADSGDMATIDTDGANDDWTGCDRVTVFS